MFQIVEQEKGHISIEIPGIGILYNLCCGEECRLELKLELGNPIPTKEQAKAIDEYLRSLKSVMEDFMDEFEEHAFGRSDVEKLVQDCNAIKRNFNWGH